MLRRFALVYRLRAAGLHLLISVSVAAVAAGVMFSFWYPGMYRSVSGGQELFVLVTSIDVVLGPLLTFAVFNLDKGWRRLRRDLVFIGAVQVAALVYGLHVIFETRPVAMVFEVDRFRVLVAADVYASELPMALPEYRRLPLAGPWLIGTREPKAGSEHNDAIFMGLQGIDRANRPKFWQPYAASLPAVIRKSRPVGVLLAHYSARAAELRSGLVGMHAEEASARFLPLAARDDWVIVLDSSGKVLGHLKADGFF